MTLHTHTHQWCARYLMDCHGIHVLLHSVFHWSLLYFYSRPSISFIYWSAAIWLSYAKLYAWCSTNPSASEHTSQNKIFLNLCRNRDNSGLTSLVTLKTRVWITHTRYLYTVLHSSGPCCSSLNGPFHMMADSSVPNTILLWGGVHVDQYTANCYLQLTDTSHIRNTYFIACESSAGETDNTISWMFSLRFSSAMICTMYKHYPLTWPTSKKCMGLNLANKEAINPCSLCCHQNCSVYHTQNLIKNHTLTAYVVSKRNILDWVYGLM